MVKIGYGNNIGSDPGAGARFLREVDLVEDAGFDGFFFSEHHGLRGYVPDGLAAAAMVLGRTTELRAGPMPLLLPLHDPVRVAETAALVDFVSQGRLILGVGAGYLPRDFEQAGVPLTDLGRRYEESLAIVRRTWRGKQEPFEGRILSAPAVDPLVHQTEPEGPPLWNAGSSPVGVRRAARLGMGLVLDGLRSSREIQELVASYRNQASGPDRQMGTVAVVRRMWFGGQDEVDKFMGHMAARLRSYIETVGASAAPWVADLRENGVSRRSLEERFFGGMPEQVGDDLQAWAAETDVDYVIAKFQFMGADEDLTPQLRRAKTMLERCAP